MIQFYRVCGVTWLNSQTSYCSRTIISALAITVVLCSCGNQQQSSNSSSSPTVAASASPASTTRQEGIKPQGGRCPSSEPIQGTITKVGKIYHLPNSPGYAQNQPELCFKDVATAKKAGYRAP